MRNGGEMKNGSGIAVEMKVMEVTQEEVKMVLNERSQKWKWR